MKILSVVGTRPQFLKLAPLSKKFEDHIINHVVVHTGQHYDKEMSYDLFNVLNIKEPDYLLEKSGSTNIQSLCNMMNKIEEICLKENPDKIIVFGDCDTTIAGALVAKKLKIYLVHIESGMRSYNKDMPEEINRLMTDHISDLLLCSTKDSVEKLKNENITKNVYFVGNLQLELLKHVCDTYNETSIIKEHKLENNYFSLMTIHREYNTTEPMLRYIFSELEKVNIDIVFPMHPRTKNIVVNNNIQIPKNLKIIKPIDYLNMTILERNCKFIITDSGGVQPEAWYLKKKCIIMRSETEWIEPLNNNNNILYDYKTPLNKFIDDFLKVEIDEIDIDCNISENIIDKVILKKKLIIFMDCHGGEIQLYLKNNINFSNNYDIIFITLNDYVIEKNKKYNNIKLDDNDSKLINSADVLILQVIEKDRGFLNNDEVIKYCKTECNIIKIPHYRNSIYGYKTLENKNNKWELITGSGIHMWNLPNKIKNINDVEETKKIIQNEIDKMNNFPYDKMKMLKSMNYNINEFRKIDDLSDIKMLDYYNNNYKKYRLFMDRQHPSDRFFFELTNRILIRLNYNPNNEFKDNYFGQNNSEPIPYYWYKFCNFTFDNIYYIYKNLKITECEWYYILLLSSNVNITDVNENIEYLKKIRSGNI